MVRSPGSPSIRRCFALVVVCLLAAGSASADDHLGPRGFEPLRLKNGLVIPYPMDKVFRAWARCKRGRHTHKAIDIGGVGPDWGIGTPILSMVRSKIIHLGRPEDDPKRYGIRDTGDGKVKRGKAMLPRQRTIDGYGTVRFFTKNHGRFRTGVLIVARVLEGRLKGYNIKYMHLADPHPDLKKGSVVQAGQELGLMGGTAVQIDPPHLHLAFENRAGKKVDPGPILSLGSTRWKCRDGKRGDRAARQKVRKASQLLMRALRKKRDTVKALAEPVNACGKTTIAGRFGPTRRHAHRLELNLDKAGPVTVRLEAISPKWKPKIELYSAFYERLYDGRRSRGKRG
ncbi:MAG: hypothetical protein ACI9WU_000264, partial [Myxococcota bacterium]